MKMKTCSLLLLCLLVVGCAKKEVRIIEVVPSHGTGWSMVFEHVVVEETKSRERHKLGGRWGETGHVFIVSERHFSE